MAPKNQASSAAGPSVVKPAVAKPSRPSSSHTSQLSPKTHIDNLSKSLQSLSQAYVDTTPTRIKLIDIFLAFFVSVGVLLMAYRVVVTSYPFNGFLASFGGCVGQFVLLAGFRSQVAPGRDSEYGQTVSPER